MDGEAKRGSSEGLVGAPGLAAGKREVDGAEGWPETRTQSVHAHPTKGPSGPPSLFFQTFSHLRHKQSLCFLRTVDKKMLDLPLDAVFLSRLSLWISHWTSSPLLRKLEAHPSWTRLSLTLAVLQKHTWPGDLTVGL